MTGWRRGRTALAAALVGVIVAGPVAQASQRMTRDEPGSDPCFLSWTTDPANEIDPDVDITQVDFRLTAQALVATVHVRQLAEHPLTSTGHTFRVDWVLRTAPDGPTLDGQSVSFTHDVVTGTHSNDQGEPLRTLRGTQVQFDVAHSAVVITAPRRAIYAQMVHPRLEPTLWLPSADAAYEDPVQQENAAVHDFTFTDQATLSFASCDTALGVRPAAVPLDPSMMHVRQPNACTVIVSDASDDAVHDYGLYGSPAAETHRPDLDITQVAYRVRPAAILAVVDVPNLTNHPQGSWTESFEIAIANTGEDGGRPWRFDYMRASDGTSAVSGKGPPAQVHVDELRGRLTFVLPRRSMILDYGLGAASSSQDQVGDVADSAYASWMHRPSLCRSA